MYNGKLYMEFIVYTVIGLGALWCLTPLSTIYFSYIVVVSFIGEGTCSTRRKPTTCSKSLKNFSHKVVSSTPRNELDSNSQR